MTRAGKLTAAQVRLLTRAQRAADEHTWCWVRWCRVRGSALTSSYALEMRGYIERHKCDEQFIRITDAGRAALKESP